MTKEYSGRTLSLCIISGFILGVISLLPLIYNMGNDLQESLDSQVEQIDTQEIIDHIDGMYEANRTGHKYIYKCENDHINIYIETNETQYDAIREIYYRIKSTNEVNGCDMVDIFSVF